MGFLPVPAAMYFDDFSSEILKYNVLDNNILVGAYDGLPNSDDEGNYIGFLMSDQPKINPGNTICTTDGIDSFQIYKVSCDCYEGNPELLKAYY